MDDFSKYPCSDEGFLYVGEGLKGWMNVVLMEDYFKTQKEFEASYSLFPKSDPKFDCW